MSNKSLSRRETLKILGTLGVSALAPGLIRQAGPAAKMPETRKKNFIFLVFDALSANHMSLYGYGRRTTPNIDRFAASSIVYHNNYSPSNFTQSSTASLLTGVHPWSHRALEFFEPLLNKYDHANIFNSLSPAYQTIAFTHNIHAANIIEQFKSSVDILKPIQELAILRANKLEDVFKNDPIMGKYAAKRWLEDFLSPGYSLYLSPLFGVVKENTITNLDNKYKDLYPLGLSESEGYVFRMEDAIDWIIEVTKSVENPFFGYFHLLPPHEDYKPRAEFYNMFAKDQYHLPVKPESLFTEGETEEQLNSHCKLYDEYIANVDWEFGRLVRELTANGVLDNTYLILTSDHGQLFERGIHGHASPTLYDSLIHTPLIIHAPGQTERLEITTPTSSIDIVPTLLHLADAPALAYQEGKVLPGLGGESDSGRTIFSMHARRNPKRAPLTKATLAAIRWPFKLVQYRGYKKVDQFDELFDLENDPEELQNLAHDKPELVSSLQEELHVNQTQAEERSLGQDNP